MLRTKPTTIRGNIINISLTSRCFIDPGECWIETQTTVFLLIYSQHSDSEKHTCPHTKIQPYAATIRRTLQYCHPLPLPLYKRHCANEAFSTISLFNSGTNFMNRLFMKFCTNNFAFYQPLEFSFQLEIVSLLKFFFKFKI